MARNNKSNLIDSHVLLFGEKVTDCLDICFESVLDVAQDISEYCKDGLKVIKVQCLSVGNSCFIRKDDISALKNNEEFKKATEKLMKECIEMESEAKQHLTALKHVQSLNTNDRSNVNLPVEFNDKLTLLKRSEKQDLKAHPKYKRMEELFEDNSSLEQQIAALREKLTGSSITDDLVVTDVEINTKCPYTGQIMVQPVRNKLCGHAYDRAGITSYILARKTKARCPAVGCGNTRPITDDVLEDHADLKKYIQLISRLEELHVS